MFLDKFDTPKTRQIAFAKTFSLIQRFYISIGVIASVGSCVLKKVFFFSLPFFYFFLLSYVFSFLFLLCSLRVASLCELSLIQAVPSVMTQELMDFLCAQKRN